MDRLTCQSIHGELMSVEMLERTSWGARLRQRLRGLVSEVQEVANADTALQASMAGLIELAAARYAGEVGDRTAAIAHLRAWAEER